MRACKLLFLAFFSALAGMVPLYASEPFLEPSTKTPSKALPALDQLDKLSVDLKQKFAKYQMTTLSDQNGRPDFASSVMLTQVLGPILSITQLITTGIYDKPNVQLIKEEGQQESKLVKDQRLSYGLRKSPANLTEKTRLVENIGNLAIIALMAPELGDIIRGRLYQGISYFETAGSVREKTHSYLVPLAYEFLMQIIKRQKKQKIAQDSSSFELIRTQALSRIFESQQFNDYVRLRKNLNQEAAKKQFTRYFNLFEQKGIHQNLYPFMQSFSEELKKAKRRNTMRVFLFAKKSLIQDITKELNRKSLKDLRAVFQQLSAAKKLNQEPLVSQASPFASPVLGPSEGNNGPPMAPPPPEAPLPVSALSSPKVKSKKLKFAEQPVLESSSDQNSRGDLLSSIRGEGGQKIVLKRMETRVLPPPPASTQLSIPSVLQKAIEALRKKSGEDQDEEEDNDEEWN